MIPGTFHPLHLPGGRDPTVTSLLHFDEGPDGYTGPWKDTVRPDRLWAGDGVVYSGGFGNPTVAKFTRALIIPNRYCLCPPHPANAADFDFGAGDWGIDFWYQATGGAADSQQVLVRDYEITFTGYLIGFLTSGTMQFYASSNGTGWDLAAGVLMGSIAIDGINHHWAVQRKAGTFYCFKDGVLQGSAASSGAPLYARPGQAYGPCIGYWSATNKYMYGYVDELRFVKGRAPFDIAGFTPPAGPYP